MSFFSGLFGGTTPKKSTSEFDFSKTAIIVGDVKHVGGFKKNNPEEYKRLKDKNKNVRKLTPEEVENMTKKMKYTIEDAVREIYGEGKKPEDLTKRQLRRVKKEMALAYQTAVTGNDEDASKDDSAPAVQPRRKKSDNKQGGRAPPPPSPVHQSSSNKVPSSSGSASRKPNKPPPSPGPNNNKQRRKPPPAPTPRPGERRPGPKPPSPQQRKTSGAPPPMPPPIAPGPSKSGKSKTPPGKSGLSFLDEIAARRDKGTSGLSSAGTTTPSAKPLSLMDQIQAGKNLKKTQQQESSFKPDGRMSLMDQIKAKQTLKKVTQEQKEQKAVSADNTGIAGAMASRMKFIRDFVDDDDASSEGSDEGW